MKKINNKVVEFCINQGCGDNAVTPEDIVYGIAKALSCDETTLKSIFPDEQCIRELEAARDIFTEKQLDITLIKSGYSLISSIDRNEAQKEKLREFRTYLGEHTEDIDCRTLLTEALKSSAIPFVKVFSPDKSISDIITYAKTLHDQTREQEDAVKNGQHSDSCEEGSHKHTDTAAELRKFEMAASKYTPHLLYSPAAMDFLRELFLLIPMLNNMGCLDVLNRRKILISIESGEGLTSFLTMYLWILDHYGILQGFHSGNIAERRINKTGKKDESLYEDWEMLRKAYTDESFNLNGILCLDISEWTSDLKKEIIKDYLKLIRKSEKKLFTVFYVPCLEKYVLDDIAADIEDIMCLSTVYVPPLGMDSMTEYISKLLQNRIMLESDDSIRESVERYIIQEKSDDSFYGFKTLTNIADNIIWEKARNNVTESTLDIDLYITPEDVNRLLYDNLPGLSDPWEQLNRLIGLESVKQQIEEIVAQIKTQRKLAERGKDIRRPVIHMLFKGNPGTGKTEVARLIGKIFRQEGILRKGHFFEYQGRNLCGRYIGETAPKTASICRDAYGSVLFIDEAYALYSKEGSERDFGREALTTLVAEMENHRDDLCVIMAGYGDEMEEMLTGNQGLESRIGFKIEFPNYSRDELCRILYMMIGDKFAYTKSFEEKVSEFFNELPDDFLNNKEFSNARFVRNIYEKVWGKAAYRCEMENKETIQLEKVDFESVIDENFKNELIEKRPSRNPIGFRVQ